MNFLLLFLDKEPMIKLAMTRQENRHNRPGMDLVRDEVSYGVSKRRKLLFNDDRTRVTRLSILIVISINSCDSLLKTFFRHQSMNLSENFVES